MHQPIPSPLPQTMIAATVHQFGPPAVITVEEVPVPVPGFGQVLVKVNAAGVGPWDGWIRAGKSALPQPLPLTLGSDLSGVIVGVGSNVTAFAPGDAVFGVTNRRFTGAYAQYALVSVEMIATKPASLTYVEAASVPVVAVTAWQALFEEARLSRGARVLIHGAGGNVGSYAVQLARASAVEPTATAFARDVSYVRSLGVDTVVDAQSERFEDRVNEVDAVVDLVGGDVQERSYRVLKRGGILVSAVSEPDQSLAARYGVTARFFLVNVTTDRLERIATLIDNGELHTRVGAVLPLSDARTAHEMLDGIRVRPSGKIVLRTN